MDLFAEVFTGNAPTPKRALSVTEIRRVRSLDMTGDRLFPLVPCEAKGEQAVRLYCAALARYNRQLRQMAEQAGVHKTLSSYVARHSWATLAYNKGVAMPDISVAMGHTNALTTKIYIEQKNQMRVARANRKVFGVINEDLPKDTTGQLPRATPLAKRCEKGCKIVANNR